MAEKDLEKKETTRINKILEDIMKRDFLPYFVDSESFAMRLNDEIIDKYKNCEIFTNGKIYYICPTESSKKMLLKIQEQNKIETQKHLENLNALIDQLKKT